MVILAGFQQVLKDDAVDSSSEDEDAWAAACAILMLDFCWVQPLEMPHVCLCDATLSGILSKSVSGLRTRTRRTV